MSPAGPGYWMNETSGVLADAILTYLETNRPIDGGRLEAIREYFEQWVIKGDWSLEPSARQGLIDWARTLKSRTDIGLWLAAAEALGMDPL